MSKASKSGGKGDQVCGCFFFTKEEQKKKQFQYIDCFVPFFMVSIYSNVIALPEGTLFSQRKNTALVMVFSDRHAGNVWHGVFCGISLN